MADLDLVPRLNGRVRRPLEVSVGRELVEADLALLGAESAIAAPPLKRLGDRHHRLAQHLARGVPPGQAAIDCGYSPSRVSILQADPSFNELVEHYRATYASDAEQEFFDLHKALTGIAKDALLELQSRLEDEPEKFNVTALQALAQMASDRVGHGPQSTNTSLNVNVDLAGRLEKARKRVADRAKVIEHEE